MLTTNVRLAEIILIRPRMEPIVDLIRVILRYKLWRKLVNAKRVRITLILILTILRIVNVSLILVRMTKPSREMVNVF